MKFYIALLTVLVFMIGCAKSDAEKIIGKWETVEDVNLFGFPMSVQYVFSNDNVYYYYADIDPFTGQRSDQFSLVSMGKWHFKTNESALVLNLDNSPVTYRLDGKRLILDTSYAQYNMKRK